MAEQFEIIPVFLALIVVLVIIRSFLPSRKRRSDTTPDRSRDGTRDGPRDGPHNRAKDRRQRRALPLPDIKINPRSILVDGSNVMHWEANTPDSATLMRVLAALRRHGNDPILCFDANVGYKLFNAHLNPEELSRLFGVTPQQVLITPSGTDANALILQVAIAHSIPVVSNDRYRDYPALAGQVERMTGTINEGVVTLRLHKSGMTVEAQHRAAP